MKNSIKWTLCLLFLITTMGNAQTRSRRSDVPDHPQTVGDPGIAWYTTWETGLAEAKRSNRPLFFMSAATTCSGVSGVF